ncbi:MAG: hypothetical protein PHS53_02600 [Candidatus Pacebacteria bacterium]|nr:hypothetical protein [Candidatus Paceibacterota bacterium]MDD5357013.1 hypothetical protein [Candidatus Paceibacterota bacterium]
MRKNEKLHSVELGMSSVEAKIDEKLLAFPSFEKMHTRQTEMLSSLSEYISIPLQKSLIEKISREAKEFALIIQKEKELQEAKKNRKRVLDENYFTEKTLDLTFFE